MKLTRLMAMFLAVGMTAYVLSAKPAAKAPPAKAPAKDAPAKVPAKPEDPCTPAPKKDSGKFLEMHESFLKRTKEGPIGLLFLGDSITAGWAKAPEVWKKYYEKYQPANFGIGGDRTQHVLWRIENGELEGISPKVVVLMIGTNNTSSNTAEDIAKADEKIVRTLRTKLPEAKVLLLGVFPRGVRGKEVKVYGESPLMEKIKPVNERLAKLDDGKMVRYLDITEKFLVDGAIPNDVMPDQLHPNVKGYQIWAEAMQPLLEEMMK